MEEALYEGVSLIEWPEKMGGYLPRKAIRINISSHQKGRFLTIESSLQDIQERLKTL